jgi:hypothetical protein
MSMKMHDMIDALQEETSNGKTFVYLTKRNETSSFAVTPSLHLTHTVPT